LRTATATANSICEGISAPSAGTDEGRGSCRAGSQPNAPET
jgi:hypothetical protein